MNTTALLDTLKSDEGWNPFVYDDTEGFATIGYGFLVDSRKGVGLPKEVAEVWLRHAVNERLAELQRLWPPFEQMPENVQLALGNMAYNLGASGVLKFEKMLAALETYDYNKAADEALDSLWARQVPNRAKRVTELIRNVRKAENTT